MMFCVMLISWRDCGEEGDIMVLTMEISGCSAPTVWTLNQLSEEQTLGIVSYSLFIIDILFLCNG